MSSKTASGTPHEESRDQAERERRCDGRASSDEFLSVSPCARQRGGSRVGATNEKSKRGLIARAGSRGSRLRVYPLPPGLDYTCDGYRTSKAETLYGPRDLLSDGDRDARAPHSGLPGYPPDAERTTQTHRLSRPSQSRRPHSVILRLANCITIIAAPLRRKTETEPGPMPR